MPTSSAIPSRYSRNGTAKRTKRATPIFRRGDIVRLPFPFAEDNRSRNRPGLVVSDGAIRGRLDILWVVMITGAGNEAWPDDIEIGPDHERFGLPIPSRIRIAKMASITADQATIIGHLDAAMLAEAMEKITDILGRGHVVQ